jgi:hypothetical protein
MRPRSGRAPWSRGETHVMQPVLGLIPCVSPRIVCPTDYRRSRTRLSPHLPPIARRAARIRMSPRRSDPSSRTGILGGCGGRLGELLDEADRPERVREGLEVDPILPAGPSPWIGRYSLARSRGRTAGKARHGSSREGSRRAGSRPRSCAAQRQDMRVGSDPATWQPPPAEG